MIRKQGCQEEGVILIAIFLQKEWLFFNLGLICCLAISAFKDIGWQPWRESSVATHPSVLVPLDDGLGGGVDDADDLGLVVAGASVDERLLLLDLGAVCKKKYSKI